MFAKYLTKNFFIFFIKNTWLFPAPCGIIKGWGVGGTGVPYFFWSELSLLLYHILKQKSIKIVKIFLKNFSKNTWLCGGKCDIIKGEVFFFFFFFLVASQLPQQQLSSQLRHTRVRCCPPLGGKGLGGCPWVGLTQDLIRPVEL